MQKIADEMDISLSALGHYFYGRNSLNTKAVSALAKLLQVDVSDISPSLDKELRQQSQSLQLSLSGSQLQERVPVRLKVITDDGKVSTEPLGVTYVWTTLIFPLLVYKLLVPSFGHVLNRVSF